MQNLIIYHFVSTFVTSLALFYSTLV